MVEVALPLDQPLTVYEFGRELLETNDLDPLYCVLHEAGWDTDHLTKFLLAFWCFYHAGTSCWVLTQGEGFGRGSERFYWEAMETAAGSKEWPRCHERRHFRGENARKSVAYLRKRGTEDLFAPLLDGPYALRQVMESVREWVGFGPWIAFKAADMLERVGLTAISFDAGAMFLFDSPREGAELLWEEERPTGVGRDAAGPWAVSKLVRFFRKFPAPPRYERPVNVQEVETALCKWKSYRKGHYKLGEDIIGLRSGLEMFSRSTASQQLLRAGERVKLW